MKFRGDTGKLRQACEDAGYLKISGLTGSPWPHWIFNDLRKDHRRLKIWGNFSGDIEMFLKLQDACRKQYGWRMISCGLQRSSSWRNGVNFVVRLRK